MPLFLAAGVGGLTSALVAPRGGVARRCAAARVDALASGAGWLSTSVDEFLLGSLPENNFLPGAWKKAFGLSDEQVFFFSYHTKADDDHAGREVWRPILRHVKTADERQEILAGLEVALTAQKLFYEGICAAGDEWDRAHGRARA